MKRFLLLVMVCLLVALTGCQNNKGDVATGAVADEGVCAPSSACSTCSSSATCGSEKEEMVSPGAVEPCEKGDQCCKITGVCDDPNCDPAGECSGACGGHDAPSACNDQHDCTTACPDHATNHASCPGTCGK
jgi:hypothetical protein